MAKRKRLTPAQSGFLEAPQGAPTPRPGPLPTAPIAQVAGEASAVAALEELSAEMECARAQGRLVLSLPLNAVDAGYLVRDRLVQEGEDMEALKASLRARGQQTPIEVVALSASKGAVSHGLISGWRRLCALRALAAEEGGARFALVKARLIAPESQQASYVAMVEENEIRSDLSHYERARIALRARQEGVYPTLKLSLNGLFGSVSRSRRSKINSFVPLVEQLDGVLKFPSAISEKLGLALSRAIQDPALCADLRAALKKTRRLRPEDELAVLQKALAPASRPRPVPKAAPPTGLHARLNARAQRIEVTGSGVDHALFEDLQAWLAARGEGCG